MQKKWINLALSLLFFSLSPISYADGLTIKPGDTLQKQISAFKGKKITIRLVSGEELTGTVKESTNELVQLSDLSGKEFFDAIIDVNKVSAILVKTK